LLPLLLLALLPREDIAKSRPLTVPDGLRRATRYCYGGGAAGLSTVEYVGAVCGRLN